MAWHQLHAFVSEPRTLAERLAESALFRGAPRRGFGVAEWVGLDEEHDPLPFPLGRVVTHADGVLLEAFSEDRLEALRRRARALGGGDVAADETRSFLLETVLADPGVLLQPQHDPTGRAMTVLEAARTWLRMGWAFLPRPDLGGRTPCAALARAEGRAALEDALAGLPAELASIRGFPRMSSRALRAILIPPAATPGALAARRPSVARGARGG
jgi:hypothetical protein